MKKKRISIRIRVFVMIAFILMTGIHILSKILQINGASIGDMLYYNFNLFVPIPLTFCIWGGIYFFLFTYIVYFLKSVHSIEANEKTDMYNEVSIIFVISAILNVGLYISWYYGLIMFSMLFVFVLLFCLALIDLRIKKENLDTEDIIFLRVPFSIYYGWIVFLTVVNISLFLQKNFGNLFEGNLMFWMILLVCFLAILTIIMIIIGRDPVFGLAMVWSYVGLLIRYLSKRGLKSYDSRIVTELILCISIFLLLILYYLCFGKSYSQKGKIAYKEFYEEENDYLKAEDDFLEEESIKHWVK